MNPEQLEAVAGFRQAVFKILTCLPVGPPGRMQEMRGWLVEFESASIPASRLRAIALSLRGQAVELARQTEPAALPEAARQLIDAADAVLVAF